MNGFDNKNIIAEINDNDILDTENFAKTTLLDIIDEDQYNEYFGIFKNNVAKFKFLGGHKKQLKMFIDFYKKVNYNEKNQQTRMKNFQKLGSMTKETDMSKKIIKENHKEAEILKTNLHEEKKVLSVTFYSG